MTISEQTWYVKPFIKLPCHTIFVFIFFFNQSRMRDYIYDYDVYKVFVLTKLMTLLVLLQFGRYDYVHHDNESLIFFLISFSKFTVNTLIFNNLLETAHKGGVGWGGGGGVGVGTTSPTYFPACRHHATQRFAARYIGLVTSQQPDSINSWLKPCCLSPVTLPLVSHSV